MEIKLIPLVIEFKAFQFALFKRKVVVTEDAIQFNKKQFLANEIIAVRYSRINRVAGNRIAKSDYKIELKSKHNSKIKITFSHVVSQGNPEKIEKVYFDIINALTPVLNNILNTKINLINSGQFISFENVIVDNKGVKIKPDAFRKEVLIFWENLHLVYENGLLHFFNNQKKVASFGYNNTWNLKVLEDICGIMIKEHLSLPVE
ncbi:MAG: hypothetical protein SFY56_08730 [Bacteroidota bacterium]|nr:hypothetical protein [Bacteroidota bacterium]